MATQTSKPNIIQRYASKLGSVAQTVAKGVGARIKEAATSEQTMKAIDASQKAEDVANGQRKAAAQGRMQARYAIPKSMQKQVYSK